MQREKIGIMFVCHGNICRSPMAEFIFKRMLEEEKLSDRFFVCSSATSTEEIGNSVYPPAVRELRSHGIDPKGKTARQVLRADYGKYDLFVCMDSYNVRNILRIFGSDPEGKVKKLLDFDGGGDVADPWYSDRFDVAYADIERGCRRLLEYCKRFFH